MEEEYPAIIAFACASHVMDLFLKDFAKESVVELALSQARKIVKLFKRQVCHYSCGQ